MSPNNERNLSSTAGDKNEKRFVNRNGIICTVGEREFRVSGKLTPTGR